MERKSAGEPHAGSAAPAMMPDEIAGRETTGLARYILIAASLIAPLLAMNQLLNIKFGAQLLNQYFGLHIPEITLIDSRYLFLLAASLFPFVFIVIPMRPQAVKGNVPWYDWLIALASLAILLWFAWNAERGLSEGWEYNSPLIAKVLAAILCVMALEALRRTSGLPMTLIVGVLALYPVFAQLAPSPFKGIAHPLTDTLAFHVVSSESLFGIPMKAFAEIVVGFIVFGLALNYTGGGKFFNDLAFALVGRMRGGAAQVGIISSGLQGSISGSVISNVISSGVVTIPAMKRTGFRADYAGAVEAVASTGAVLMPPVMGSTAFVMASFLGKNYGEIALAATVPALLFYIALVVQVDAYSARLGLRGMKSSELPRLGEVMKEGWFYIPVFALLIFLLVWLQEEALAPFYATALLVLINQLLPKHRMSWAQLGDFAVAVARGLAELVAILMAVGFIIGALSMTGLAGTLANDLVYLAGGAPLILLIMGAITSFIFGMGMTVTACYIFLAIVLAPPLVKAGLDPLAVHLFIMYWGMVSFITPPVALATFAAAPLAGVSAMRIGLQSIRLGTAIYLVPFCFVLNPALLFKGDAQTVTISIVAAFAGLIVMAAALQGYVAGIGLIPRTVAGWLARLSLIAGGLLFAAPVPWLTGLPFSQNLAIAAMLTAAGLIVLYLIVTRKTEAGRITS
ncbi:MAG: TRAP transporter fused permease subunit [Xanthobacteraceae bacterium]|nr:TRAP transporter fused permease subunit [Xanthobacteraceae bacterium]QYK46297.1 MAG: TRAP transporter fused permease subunit [Xanthobacteraceae bacterium]